MDASTPLWKAHDLSQSLQDKIEVLPNVGRAFVHVDHETTHYPVRSLATSFSFTPPFFSLFRCLAFSPVRSLTLTLLLPLRALLLLLRAPSTSASLSAWPWHTTGASQVHVNPGWVRIAAGTDAMTQMG